MANSPAPPSPWIARDTISCGSVCEKPQARLAAMNSASAGSSSARLP